MLQKERRKWVPVLGLIGLLVFLSTDADAVPSFARQTGQYCNVCHTVFPELTPFGRQFKLRGYTMSTSDKPYEFPPPIAGMAQISFTHTASKQPEDSVENTGARLSGSSENDFVYFPQQASLFYAGRVYDKTGAFVQGTYDGVEDEFILDLTDFRFANNVTLGSQDLIYGLTINNTPTVQDVWNSTPAWGFPSASSDVSPGPSAGTMIDGGLDQQVGGIGVYGFWNNLVYGELTLYRTARDSITKFLGAGTPTDLVVDDVAPYWRLAVEKEWGDHSLEVGTYGMAADIFPEGSTHGSTDQFLDIALDAQYQYIIDKHIFSVQTTWIHEDQDWDASFDLGDTARHSLSLETFKINLNYYYRSPRGLIGGSAGFFSTTGDKDTVLYSPDPVDGSKTGSPDSRGFILELDYLPFGGERRVFAPKFSLQYTMYDEFNGSHSNYDGFGRDASDNNTIYALVWLMF